MLSKAPAAFFLPVAVLQLHSQEKLEIARQLTKLGVDVIEAGVHMWLLPQPSGLPLLCC
jgi:hypothetical protein